MARKPRVEFDGALYHVIARGNRRQRIFHDSGDYEAYLTRLEHYRLRDGLKCYAWLYLWKCSLESGASLSSVHEPGCLFMLLLFSLSVDRPEGPR